MDKHLLEPNAMVPVIEIEANLVTAVAILATAVASLPNDADEAQDELIDTLFFYKLSHLKIQMLGPLIHTDLYASTPGVETPAVSSSLFSGVASCVTGCASFSTDPGTLSD